MENNCNICPAQPVKPSGCCGCEECKPFSTKYYHLPLWRANDVTSWMVGLNKAMTDIDQLFHDFALRTGTEGEPSDLVETVQALQASVDCLEKFRVKTIEDLAATTKVVSDMLGNIDLINQKIRGLEFDQSNTNVRVKGIEQQLVDIKNDIKELYERADVADAGIEENTQKFADLQKQLGEEIATRTEVDSKLNSDILDLQNKCNEISDESNTGFDAVRITINNLVERIEALEAKTTGGTTAPPSAADWKEPE